jgi:hypothetical protein|tara:strand:+ start:235 stop:1164 length:930 start_codon:yes stop_codon:yes gene_type:complete
MPNWKKVVVSGSSPQFNHITASGAVDVAGALTLGTALAVAEGGIGATTLTDKAVLISQDSGTDAIGSIAMATNGQILVGGTNGPAVEAAADVAGTGLDAAVGDGTLAINVAAAQTSITSIINSSLAKIGTAAAQEYITFGTANEVNTFVNNTERFSVTATGADLTGNLAISANATIAGNATVTGDLIVNGTTSYISSSNLIVRDSFGFFATGSAGANVDAGILVQSGSVADTGSALYHDITAVAKSNPGGGRWAVAKTVAADASGATPGQFVVTTHLATSDPDIVISGSYGVGEMHINTATEEIFIRTS